VSLRRSTICLYQTYFRTIHCVQILKKERIDYEIIEKYGVPIFKFASGVEMDFDDNSVIIVYSDTSKEAERRPPIIDRNDWILNGIRLFEH
jgi:hypothetical protein